MRLFMFLSLGIALFSCTSNKSLLEKTSYLKAPPGTIALNDSIYVDIAEVTNHNWMEYMHHSLIIYQEDSPEFRLTLPDTASFIVTQDIGSLEEDSIAISLYIDAYRDFPLVGITLDQAKAYAEWRSNRVFEMYLVNGGFRTNSFSEEKPKDLTTEQFLSDPSSIQYQDQITHYPQYFIPSSEHYELAMHALNHGLLKTSEINSVESEQNVYNDTILPYSSVTEKERKAKNMIYHISDNVAEMTSDGLTFGGSGLDSLIMIQNNITEPTALPNIKTGFRNFCRWVKIDYNKISKLQ